MRFLIVIVLLIYVQAIFALSTLVIAVHGSRLIKRRRTFHAIAGFITTITALSYLALATSFGAFYVPETHIHPPSPPEHPPLRAIYISRFIEWFLTVPTTSFALGILTGLPWLDIILGTLSSVGIVASGLLAGFQFNAVGTWFFFAIAVVFYLSTIYVFGIRGFQGKVHMSYFY